MQPQTSGDPATLTICQEMREPLRLPGLGERATLFRTGLGRAQLPGRTGEESRLIFKAD